MTNRRNQSVEKVSVLVAEQGAEWLGWARKLRGGANALIVLIQGNSEDPDSFAERVSKRITRLHKSGTTIERAAFVGREELQDGATETRSKILRKLTSVLTWSGSETRLYLDPASPNRARSHNLMQALGSALGEMTRGSGLSISVGPVMDPKPVG